MSSESIEVPARQPTIDLGLKSNCRGETANGSPLAPTMTNLPSIPMDSFGIKEGLCLVSFDSGFLVPQRSRPLLGSTER